jgi:hypothetical protein
MCQTKHMAGTWASDTLDGHVKLLDGNQYAQVFSKWKLLCQAFPMAPAHLCKE